MKKIRSTHTFFQTIVAKLRMDRGAQFLIASSMFANAINFLYNAYLGRKIGFEEFGLISIIGSLLSISQIPLSSYSRTVVHRAAFLLGKYQTPASWYWQHLRKKSIKPGLILAGIWLIVTPLLAWYFRTDRLFPFIVFTPVWLIGVAAAVDSGFLSGSHVFGAVATMTCIDVVMKFISTVILVELGLAQYVYMSIPLSEFASFLAGWLYARRIRAKTIPVNASEESHFPKKFFFSAILTKISAVAVLSFDVLLVKHYLPATEAGQYALLSFVGMMIYFLGSLFTQFIIPFVSRDEGAGKIPQKVFMAIFWSTFAVVFFGFLVVGVGGFITVPLLFGERARVILPYVPWYTAAMVCYALGSTIVSYYQARHRYESAVISSLTGLGIIIGTVLFHNSIAQVTTVVLVNSIIFFCSTIMLHRFEEQVIPLFRNLVDFAKLFTEKYKKPTDGELVSILIFNWRDTKHVWAGGAEGYLHELAKRWVAKGHRVTIFCGNDQKNPRNEVIDGVQMVRRGGFYTVYFWAFLYYVLRFRGNFDVVIDSENGIPFFTPFYVRVPTFLLIHHVHQEVLRKHLIFPLSRIAMFLESEIMPRVYQNVPVITVSDSSKNDIIALGFASSQRVHVIYPGIEILQFTKAAKTKNPSILYLGRLRHYKYVEVAIEAFASLIVRYPTATFTIAGEGNHKPQLMNLVKALKIEDKVAFLGKVSESEKVRLLGTSWVMVQPSLIEGWGMTVIEANACGTPVVASRVNGLKDSVQHQKTGLLFEPNNVGDLAKTLDLVLSNKVYRENLSTQAYTWSQTFEWEMCAQTFLAVLMSYASHNIKGSPALQNLAYGQSQL